MKTWITAYLVGKRAILTYLMKTTSWLKPNRRFEVNSEDSWHFVCR